VGCNFEGTGRFLDFAIGRPNNISVGIAIGIALRAMTKSEENKIQGDLVVPAMKQKLLMTATTKSQDA
jgi:hypothetical protein